MHQNSTITRRVIHIILLVDFGVLAVVAGQDIHNNQRTDKVQDTDQHFSMQEFQYAVQDMQGPPRTVILYAQSATMEELVQRLKIVVAPLDGLEILVTWTLMSVQQILMVVITFV